MKILVDDIPKEGLKLEFSLDPDWVRERVTDPGDDFKFEGEIHVKVELHKSSNGIKVKGSYSGIASLVCPRCLDSFQSPMEESFHIRLMSETLVYGKRELHLTIKDLDIEYFDGIVVDLEDIILSELVVNFPHDKLCSEDCRGLCPVCGVNWNHESCEHVDVRERPLKNRLWDQLKVAIKTT